MHEEDTFLRSALREMWQNMEQLQLTAYLRHVGDWRRVLWVNFWGGVARGFGFAVGFTLLSAAALVMLERFSVRSIPGLESFFDQMLQLVESHLK